MELDGVAVSALAERWGVAAVEAWDRVGSTNDRAWDLALGGADCPVVVVADVQDSGRGRRGKPWTSDAGGLWMSVALASGGPATVLPLRVGLAVVEALMEVAPGVGRPGVKWPNDVWLGQRKVAGILCEARHSARSGTRVVVGIGVNVAQASFDPPLLETATSVHLATGERISRAAVAEAILSRCGGWPGGDVLEPDEVVRLRHLDPLKGKRLVADGGIRGVGRGVKPDGSYMIEDTNGHVLTLRAGGIQMETSAS